MATRMVHPNHGTTFAVGAEISWNEKNGWKIEAEPVVEPPVLEKIPVIEWPVEAAPKRGRPRGS